jgi:hypothetical protein
VNNNPKDFDNEYVFPRDMYIGKKITNKNAGTYFNFIKMLGNNRNNNLHCTCALDNTDVERIIFMGLSESEGMINFTTLSDSIHDSNKLFASLIKKYNENNQDNF